MFTDSKVVQIASLLALALYLTGCGSSPSETSSKQSTEKQAANLAKLSDEEKPLAQAQGYCAVTGEPLGSMGPPIKLMLKEQPVFICCKGCEKKAKSNPDRALAKVAELKAKVKSEGTR